MSHIPAAAMPHAKANNDTVDEQPSKQEQPEPEPTGTIPLVSQAPVDGTMGAQSPPSPEKSPERRSGLRSPVGIAALTIGGLAVVAGVAAALLPKVRGEKRPKQRKQQKKRRRKQG